MEVKARLDFIAGGVTAPAGFRAGATYAGIKKKAATGLDLGLIISEVSCAAAALFTTNRVKAAPVIFCQERMKLGKARAVLVNSGCANACTGARGLADISEITKAVADTFALPAEEILMASTGIIGQCLPVDLIKQGIGRISPSPDGGTHFARAIMTTDTVSKEAAVRVKVGNTEFSIGGVAKGSGMIHPNMGTMLCFLSTDAAIEADLLHWLLKQAADVSFNMVSVDGDTSTNDMVLMMANGLAKNEPIHEESELAQPFKQALEEVCKYLAKSIARDGEGASRLIEVTVSNAPSITEARTVARAITSSSLVKTAVHGADPNWGRVLAAAGRSSPNIDEAKATLYIGNCCLFRDGRPQSFTIEKASAELRKKEVNIELKMNLGTASATAWGCDLSEDYVKINSDYTT